MNTDEQNTEAFDNLLEFIRLHRGFDFTGYKRASLERRINRRMQAVNIQSYHEYLDYLQAQPDEFTALFNTILINVTRFFRDPEGWTYLAQAIVPEMLSRLPAHEPVRVWNPGCSTGKESCTIAIVLAEALGFDEFRNRVKIFGTDVDEEALWEARQATYTETDLEMVPEEYRSRYFELVDGQYQFHKDLRRSIIYGRHDLVQDAPISRVDLLVCRNTLMYFNADAQARILSNFHFSLKEGGVLLLGRGEMLLTHGNLFAPINLKQRVFRKMPGASPRVPRPVVQERANDSRSGDSVAWLRESAFDAGTIAQIVLDADHNLAFANSLARQQFGINESDVGRPIQDLQISYDPTELRSKIESARKERRAATYEDVRWAPAFGEPRVLTVELTPLPTDDNAFAGMSVSFIDTTRNKSLQLELERAQQDLETAHEELESTVEEVETTNEALQSTNEELETMNEELQSTNEELEAINTELRRRTTELNDVNAFLESILTSLRVGVAVVDPEFQVQIWNGRSTDLWGLRPDEVVGNHFLNLDIGLPVEQLRGPIRQCLTGKSETIQVVLRCTNRLGRQIDCRVTCMPHTGNDSEVRGAIMLMEAMAASQD